MEIKLFFKINKNGSLVFCITNIETDVHLRKNKLNLEIIKPKIYYKMCEISKEHKISLHYKDKIEKEIENVKKILRSNYMEIIEANKIEYYHPIPKKRRSCC
jgi:hypothetical protein